MTPLRVVVVGAGLGGLAAAIRLQAQGHDVTVVERRARIGGRAYQIQEAGYTFDTGPSLITMPFLLDELFEIAGASRARELPLRMLDPFYRIHWQDDPRTFDFSGSHDRMREQVARFSSRDAAHYDAFIAASRRIYEEAILGAGRRPFLRAVDFAGLVPTMLRLGAARSLASFVASHFDEAHVRQAFDFHSLFIGGDPYRVPAVYAALGYLQIAEGVWYADGGVYSLVRALGHLVERGGGRILTGESVTSIATRDGRVRHVGTASGLSLPADLVVSNADPLVTRRALLAPRDAREPLPWRVRRPSLTMSCFLLYLGTTRRYPQLQHHTLVVGSDYRGFIADVTRRRRISRDLSLYIHAPSRTEPGMAAPGGESLYVLLPVPNLASGDDWDVRGPELRDRVVDYLEHEFGLEHLGSSIAVEHAFTPAHFASELWAADGNAFGVEPLLTQSAYFRQPNRDRTVSGLYHVGAGTHPGGGIPGVLLTAEVTAGVIASDLRSGRLGKAAA